MADQDTKALLESFAAAPEALRLAVTELEPHSYDRSPSPDEWTPRQIVRHLADSETMAAVRIRLAIAQQQPTLPLYDQEAWARNLDYARNDTAALSQSVEVFTLLRAGTARLLAALPAEGWARTAHHPERGQMTVRDLLALYTSHAQGHLDQLHRNAAG